MSNARKEDHGRNTASTDEQHQPGRYEIRLKGRLDARWAAWFDGMTFTHEGGGATRIHGPVADQAALHGLLQRVRDLGLPLCAVRRVDPEQARGPGDSADTDHDAP